MTSSKASIFTIGNFSQFELLSEATSCSNWYINICRSSQQKIRDLVEAISTSKPEDHIYVELRSNKMQVSASQPKFYLNENTVTICKEDRATDDSLVVCSQLYDTLSKYLPNRVSIDAGHVELKDLRKDGDALVGTCWKGGYLRPKMSLEIDPSPFIKGSLSETDEQIIIATRNFPNVSYVLSRGCSVDQVLFIKNLAPTSRIAINIEETLEKKELLKLSMIENVEIWFNRSEIVSRSGPLKMAQYYLDFTSIIPELHCPIIMSGGVLESMVYSSTPSKAEICNIIDTMRLGYSGYVLSYETLLGQNAVNAAEALISLINGIKV